VDDKLRRGYELAAHANGDPDALGLALLALHGALEEHLDESLRQLDGLTADERQAMLEPGYGWSRRLELAQRHRLVTRDQAEAIYEVNRQRNAFAHGGAYLGRQRDLDGYATLVASLVGRRQTAARPVVASDEARPSPARAASGPPPAVRRPSPARASEGTTVASASAWSQRAAVRSTRRRDLVPDSPWVRAAIGAIAVLVVVLALWRALPRSDGEQPQEITSRGPLQQQITPGPTAPPASPTPAVRQGRIVGLGGGIGLMHEPAGFDTPTLPPRLLEGTVVTMVETETVEAGGSTWVKISYGGYEGWVPVQNVDQSAPAAPAEPTPLPGTQ
jgi:hypothetical protein